MICQGETARFIACLISTFLMGFALSNLWRNWLFRKRRSIDRKDLDYLLAAAKQGDRLLTVLPPAKAREIAEYFAPRLGSAYSTLLKYADIGEEKNA